MQIEVMDPVLVSLNDQRLVNQPSVYSSFVQRFIVQKLLEENQQSQSSLWPVDCNTLR